MKQKLRNSLFGEIKMEKKSTFKEKMIDISYNLIRTKS